MIVSIAVSFGRKGIADLDSKFFHQLDRSDLNIPCELS